MEMAIIMLFSIIGSNLSLISAWKWHFCLSSTPNLKRWHWSRCLSLHNLQIHRTQQPHTSVDSWLLEIYCVTVHRFPLCSSCGQRCEKENHCTLLWQHSVLSTTSYQTYIMTLTWAKSIAWQIFEGLSCSFSVFLSDIKATGC